MTGRLRRMVAAAVLAAATAAPRLTLAQAGDSASCIARQLPAGVAQDTVMLDIHTLPDSALSADYEGLLLEGVAEEFHAPPTTQVPVFNHWRHSMGGVALDEAGTEVEGEVGFDLDAKGRITHVAVTASTLAPEIDDSLTHAVLNLAASGMVPPPASVPRTGKAFVLVGVRSVRGYSALERPLYRETVQLYPLARDLTEEPNNPPISYPILAAEARVGDSVEVDFVVDTTGRVEPATTRYLRGHYLDFMQALGRGVSKFRFQPAMIGTCPIEMRYRYTYVFRTVPR